MSEAIACAVRVWRETQAQGASLETSMVRAVNAYREAVESQLTAIFEPEEPGPGEVEALLHAKKLEEPSNRVMDRITLIEPMHGYCGAGLATGFYGTSLNNPTK